MGSETDSRTKRARTSRPKVKTGCANCKQRRIKCDEKRPACTQCIRSKKECGGYPPPPRSARPFEVVPIAPKPGLTLLSAAPAPPLAAAPPRALSLAPAPAPAAALAPAPVPIPVPTSASTPALAPALAPTSNSGHIPVTALAPVHPLQRSFHPPLLVPFAAAGAQHVPTEETERHNAQRQQQRQSQLQSNLRRAQKLNFRRNGLPSQTWSGLGLPPSPALNILYEPSTALPITSQEEHYFRLFRFHTANELSGFFDNIFWSKTVLVACHADAAIRHAVVALGALYKTLEKTTETPPTSPKNPASHDAGDTALSHWEMALRHYSNACHALAMTSAQDAATQRTRLMASVLLACFDSFVGDHKQAIVQIQTGLGLLERLRAERRRATGPERVAEEPVEGELTQMFTRLAIQAKSYDMAFHFPRPYVIQLLPAGGGADSPSPEPLVPRSKHSIPEQFTDLREARLVWDALCERIFRFMEYMLQQAQGPPNLLPRYMTQYGEEFVRDNEAWAKAFEPLLQSRTNPGISGQEKAGIAVLKMFQIMAQILYLMTFSDSEMKFDAFQPHFQAIVRLAAEVVGDEERRAAAARCPDPAKCPHYQSDKSGPRGPCDPLLAAAAGGHGLRSNLLGCRAGHIKASFSADLGIVPPLYVVATKSRDRVLRRQAIHLLRSSARREGMWDSELMARVGMWVVGIEEDGEEEEFLQQSMRTRLGSESSGATVDTPTPPPPPANTSQAGDCTGDLDRQRRSVSTGGTTADGPAAGPFGDLPLGPGGNARWDARRTSGHDLGQPGRSREPSVSLGQANQSLPYYMYMQKPVPAEKRVLVKSCEFDLREHTATLKCGTRGLTTDAQDPKWRSTYITW